ncbi:serine/threonine protein kinase [Actinomadura logoneensis]|uniref:non-specific serine/threonine protein kinase n=1 Tax=Actinomadura logoneensis TaxID=2293572 RepID=A0A372JQH0_9ACTN|nr:serine/threonine-protein kinase [Actinomadura logoneensis]RFU42220.1 serine/threonine protein kinase [Actinomadura logoneensis]
MSWSPWRLPGYTELMELGSGTQGRVVLARYDGGGSPVAIKYLAPDQRADPRLRAMFRQEAALLQRVANPHVARLLDYVERPEGLAIVMEAVPGRSLRAVLDSHNGPLAPEAALLTLKGSLLGLAAAHAVGIVHRDYKPGNVLIQDDGRSKLIDFGVAVLTGQAGIAGTPAYMAPEQWSGQPASPATDIYAATCVFLECASGRKPFQAQTLDELRALHLHRAPSLEGIPELFHPLVMHGLAKDPTQRLWDANAFVRELEARAVSTYGHDWERRGLIALAAVAGLITAAIPTTLLAGTFIASGSTSAAAATGALSTGVSSAGVSAAGGSAQAGAASQASAQLGATGTKGVLSKVGGTKGAVAICGAGAAATAAAVLLWPSGPKVGGQASGTYVISFTKPGVLLGQPNMPASETPFMRFQITVSPARARPGTQVSVVTRFNAKSPFGVAYSASGQRRCYGEKDHPPGLIKNYNFGIGQDDGTKLGKNEGTTALFPIPPNRPGTIPTTIGQVVTTVHQVSNNHQPYVQSECAYLSTFVMTDTFILPPSKTVKPGRYLLSQSNSPRITRTSRDNVDIPPSSAGATATGTLPVFTVLKG